MAVPTTAYLTEKLSATNDIGKYIFNSSNNSGDGYGNTTDDISVINDNIKAYFFLDLLMIAEKDNIKGFIGLVKDPSINKAYHNPLRFSNMRLTKDNDTYIVLKDAGLNTYGIGGIDNVLSSSSTSKDDLYENFPPRITDTTIYYSFKSAYYFNSVIKVYFEQEYLSEQWVEVFSSTLSQNGQISNKIAVNITGRAGIHRFKIGNINDEGTYYSTPIEVIIKRAYAVMKYDSTYASYAYNGSTTRGIYYDTNPIVSAQGGVGAEATTFSKNDVAIMSPSDRADFGFYTLNNKWYEYKYYEPEDVYVVTRMGNCNSWEWLPDDPAYRFYPEFFTEILLEFEEATLSVTSNNSILTSGAVNNNTNPPSFPSATYTININANIVRQFIHYISI